MQPEHVPLVTDADRLLLAAQVLVGLVLVLGAYATMKLGRGWWRPQRPRR